MIREAVILAAGQGLRLAGGLPKGLMLVSGRPVLAWVLTALAECGVETAHLVVGDSNRFEPRLADLPGSVEIRLTECPDWQLGNGRSAAAAEPLVAGDRFFLLMSDHLITAAHLRCVLAMPVTTCALATSAPAPWIDLADATKVDVDATGLITAIGKDLLHYTAIDTGVFAMTRAIFPALEEARQAGEYALTAGNRRLCRDGLLRAAPVGELRWFDIDTPADLMAADAAIRRTGAP